MADVATGAAPKETGGLLLGWWDVNSVIVRHAVEVPDRRAGLTRWVRRPRIAHRVLRRALAELDHPLLGYVGDWHVHPALCEASAQDLASIARTSRQYDQPVVLVVWLPDNTVDVHAAQRGEAVPATLTLEDR